MGRVPDEREFKFGGDKLRLVEQRLIYIQQHGAGFLFRNEPPPAAGYPRDKNWRLLLPSGGE